MADEDAAPSSVIDVVSDAVRENGHGAKSRSVDTAAVDIEAARLRGQRMTYREIAAAMGCSVTTAHDRVQRAYKAARAEATDVAREFERERLDRLWREADEISKTTYYQTAHGKVVRDPETGERLVDPTPNLTAIARKQSIAESYRKLGGLDEPTKVEQHGTVKYEIVGVDTDDLALS